MLSSNISRHMDQTDRNMSALTVQDEDENSSDQDTQLASGSNLNVNSEGPVQIGTGSTVNSPVYNNCSIHHHHHYHPSPYHPVPHNDYLRWAEQNVAALGPGSSHPGLPSCPLPQQSFGDHLKGQPSRNEDTTDRKTFHHSHHHGDRSSSYHVPCPDCLPYHHNDHLPLAETPRTQHSQLPHHAVPQLLPSPQQTEMTERKETSASRRDPQCSLPETSPVPSVVTSDVRHHVTTGQQEAKNESNEKQIRPKQATEGQRSSKSPRSPDGDVMYNVTRAGPGERKETVTAKTADRENVKSKNTSTVSDVTQDSVCIFDSAGQALEPGDAVWIGSGFSAQNALYVGNQRVMVCLREDKMVVKQKLEMTSPFRKCKVYRGECPVYPPRQRVERATSKIGERFTEGDRLDGLDFPWWVFTGLGRIEVGDQTAGTDSSHLNVYLYYTHTSTFYTPITYLISLSTVLMFIRNC